MGRGANNAHPRRRQRPARGQQAVAVGLCPAFSPTEKSLLALDAWIHAQKWPQGTELTPPEKLHVTAFYARQGLDNEDFQSWVGSSQPRRTLRARVKRLELFDLGDGDTQVPVVLILESDEIVREAEQLAQAAEQRFGIEPVQRRGGYRPHITVAKIPAATEFELPAPPQLEIELDHLHERHRAKLER